MNYFGMPSMKLLLHLLLHGLRNHCYTKANNSLALTTSPPSVVWLKFFTFQFLPTCPHCFSSVRLHLVSSYQRRKKSSPLLLFAHFNGFSLLTSHIIWQYALLWCDHPSFIWHFSVVISCTTWFCSAVFSWTLSLLSRHLVTFLHPLISSLQQLSLTFYLSPPFCQ